MKLIYSFKHKLPSGEVLDLALRKPTRLELDEVDMVYSQFLSDCLKRGILTREMLLKVYKNFDGALSDNEIKEYYKLMESFLEVSKKLEKAKTKKEREVLTKERAVFFAAIQEIEAEQEKLFDRTADTIARNKIIIFLVMLLSLKKDGDNYLPVYSGVDFEEKYENFSVQEENDWDDAHSVLNHLTLLTSFWYYGDKSLTEEDMKAFDSLSQFFVELKEPIAEDESSPVGEP